MPPGDGKKDPDVGILTSQKTVENWRLYHTFHHISRLNIRKLALHHKLQYCIGKISQ